MVVTADTNLVNTIIADHRRLDTIWTELDDVELDGPWRRVLLDHAIAVLTTHLVAEEHYLYPLVRSHIDGGAEVADAELDEHTGLEQVMRQLADDSADAALGRGTAELARLCRAHMTEEEDLVLPAVSAACGPITLQKRGALMRRSKQFAPTRPHPDTPNRPPANVIVDPGTSLIDRIRDRFASGP